MISAICNVGTHTYTQLVIHDSLFREILNYILVNPRGNKLEKYWTT